MSVWSLFKRIVRKEGARANSSRFHSHGVLRDPSNDSLNREESFRVEALEPRILLSADPVLGEMARIADKAGWDDPLANTAAIVDIIDDVAGQDSKVAEIETLEPIDPEVVWPEAWSEGVASADPDTPHLDHLTLAVDATGAAAINLADAQATIDEATALWEAAVGTPVTGLTFSVGQLSGRELASYSAGQITIDDNAAGAGWFIDATLSDNAEYTTLDGYTLRAGAGDAATSVDLLTAVLHELGHAYGFDHGDGLALMGAELDLGERLLLPTIVPADPASLPALSSQLYYQVLADGAITAYADAALTEQVLTTTGVTELIGLSGGTDALIGADTLFDNGEGTFAITGPDSGTLSFATDASTTYTLSYAGIGLLRGGNDTDTALYVIEGQDVDTVWDITSVNAGTLTSENGTTTFENIGKLVGGTQDDAIIYAAGALLTHGFDNTKQDATAGATNVYEMTVGDFVTLSLGDATSVNSTLLQNQTVDGFVIGGAAVALEGVDVATLTVSAATLFAGSDGEAYFTNKANGDENLGTGVEGENFNFDLRFYRQAYTDGGVSGYHVWVSLGASIDQLTLINADAIEGSIGSAEILLNAASEGAVISGANTAGAVVLRETTPFVAATAEFASVTGTAALAFQEKAEPTPGNFIYTDVAYFAGGVTLTKTTADVDLPSGDTVFGDLLVFQLQDASAFIGVGVDLPSVLIAPADIEFDTTDAEGVLATDFNFTLGLFKTQATTTDPSVIYGGVSFTTAAQAFGLPETELIARELSVKLNAASDLSTALDWTQAALQNPAGTSYLDLDFDGIELLANVEIAIADAVSIAGQMELSVKTQTIDDGAISAANATVVTFKLSDGFFAAGTSASTFDTDGTLISEPFTRDVVDGPPTGVTAAFQGFYGTGIGFELAIVARGAQDAAGPESWVAFRATVDAIDVVGLGDPSSFNIDGRDFLVTGNFASTSLTPTIMNWQNLSDDLTGPQLDLTDATLGLNGLEQFKIGGTLTLDIPDAVYLTSTFTMAVVADVEATAVANVTGDLLLLTLTETTVFGGAGAQFADNASGERVIERGNAAGVYIENAGLALGVLIDQGADLTVATDDTTYIGLVGGFDLAQILGLGNVEAQANDVDLKCNIAVDALGVDVAKLDWTTINYSDAATALADLDSSIDFALGGVLFYGDGFVYLGGGFSIATGGYTVSGGGTAADFIANVTTFTVTDAALFAGVGGGFTYDSTDPTVITGLIALADLEGATGFDASGVSAELAFVNEEAGSLRSWSAVDVSVASADLAGLPAGFVASTTNLSFRTNVADAVSGTKLDWTTLTLDATDFDAATGLAQVAEINSTLNVAFGGSFHGEIDGSVLLAGTLSGEIVTLDTLDALPGDVAANENVNVMRFSVNSGYVFAGVGGSFTQTDGVVDGIAAGGTGFAGQNLSFDLLSISQGQSDPTIQGTTQSWTALQAGAEQLDVRGINGIDLKAYDLEIRLNSAATTDATATAVKLDWTTLDATDAAIFDAVSITDAADGITSDLDFSVQGAVEVRIEDNVLLFGAFGIDAQTKTINDGNGIEVADASVLSLSITGATLFAGAGGAFIYDGTSGRATGLEDAGTGIAVQDANLELGIISQQSTATTPLSWLAVAGEIGQADLRGIDGIVAIARDITFRFNSAATDTTKLEWSGISDFNGTRIGTIEQTLDLSFGGEIELNIQDNVIVAADFSGSVQSVSNVTDGVITIADAQLVQFNLADAYLFVGDDGAFTRVDDLASGIVNGVADQGTGFAVTNAALDLYVVNETPATVGASARSWTGLYATAAQVAPRGMPDGLEIAVSDIAITFNKATNADTTAGTKLDWVNVAQFTAVPDVFDAGTDLKVSGTLTLDAFGFVDLGATFDLQVISGVTAQLDTDAALEDAKLLLLGMTLTDSLFIGQPGGVGISVGSGNVAVALLSAVPDAVATATVTTIPSATAITASLGDATITGLPADIDFVITSVTLDYYTHVPLSASDPGFDWTTVVVPDETTSGEGVFFEYGPLGAPLTAQFNATADRTLVTGAVTFSAFEFIGADATFSFAQDIVDVDINSDQSFDLTTDMDNASLTRISLGVVGTVADPGLTIGIRDGPGVSVASAELVFAGITSSDPALDARGYFGLKANIDTATLEGVDAIAATLNNGTLELNSAATQGSLAPLTVLDWTQAVNLDSTEWSDGTAITPASYDVLSATNTNGVVEPETVTVLDLNRDGVALYADATIVVGDFVHIRGEATLIAEQDVAARTLDNATTFNTSVLRLGLANIVVFAGTGTPDYLTDATGRATAVDPESDVVGVALTVDSLGILLVSETPESATATAPLKSWYAIKASGTAALLGINGLTLSGTLNVAINGTSTPTLGTSTLDFSDTGIWNVTVGSNPAITFDDLNESVLEVRGSIVLGVEEYVFISGEFAFRKGDALLDVVLADGQARKMSAITVGARDVNIFVGTGYDQSKAFGAQSDLVGLQISNGFVALALLQSVDALTGLPIAAGGANAGSYTALNAGGDVTLVGIDGLTLAAYDFEVSYNAASVGRAIDFDTNNLTIPTGLNAADDVTLSMAAEILEVTGFAVIGIDQYVFLSGNVTFSKGLVLPAAANPTTKNFAVTQISGSNINAFVGAGGPYFVLDTDARTSTAPADPGSAVGVAIENITFDLALLSEVDEVTTGTNTSYVATVNGDRYTALYAEVAGVDLVGVGGVALEANNIKIKVNQGRAGAPTGPQVVLPAFDFTTVTGLSPGTATSEADFLYTFKEQGFADTVIGFEAIGASAGTGASLLINTSGVKPASLADADFALQADITFERTALSNGQIVTKISATDVTASLGTIDFAATGNALILITPAGLSANIDITFSAVSFTDGRNTFAFASPTFRLEINTATVAVNQVFNVAEYVDSDGITQTTRTLSLPAGKFIRITGENLGLKIDLGNATGTIGASDTPELEFSGTISIAQITDCERRSNTRPR